MRFTSKRTKALGGLMNRTALALKHTHARASQPVRSILYLNGGVIVLGSQDLRPTIFQRADLSLR